MEDPSPQKPFPFLSLLLNNSDAASPGATLVIQVPGILGSSEPWEAAEAGEGKWKWKTEDPSCVPFGKISLTSLSFYFIFFSKPLFKKEGGN